ncbi:hypothetical protein [Anaeromyxobacter paludicola]|uniref:DnaA N-terminal domain-containing protein n=1 Tax=Anaeromyxobacter paludicola TaxID=2918171 RepID=A0ABN6N180_9BACT|nr:hypothetical protein [Anaeromyxobacter paludicola]BDG06984.1 hypothetical protein AMPC_00970 [Anaeromyxobacter paludicola]
MAGLPWVKVATDFTDDPKALALAHRLDDPRAPLHLPAVWGHFARHYADGSMPDSEDAIRALERAALWGGAGGALVDALLAVGLLERKRKRIVVHAWGDWQEGHTRKLERDRERMRAKRAETRGTSRATVERGSRDGRGTEEIERRGEEDPSLRSVGAAAAPVAPALKLARSELEKQPSSADGFQEVVRHWFAAWERAGRGKHSPLRQEDGANLKRLVRQLGADELMARMDRALADQWFLERGDLALFVRQRDRYAQPGRPAAGAPAGPTLSERVAAAQGPEWRRVLEALLRLALEHPERIGAFERWLLPLQGSLVSDVLVVLAPDAHHASFVADNYRAGIAAVASEALGRAVRVDVTAPPLAAAGLS